MTNGLLDSLKFPESLKELSIEQLEQLAGEIRQRLLEIGDFCGGHLASNLGVVELTLVLHTLFDSPQDKLVWDTSHQAYVHKMLTGRLKQMFTIRQEGGLSGFTKITESPHDIFGAGHASTALSAALGLAHSRDLQNENYKVVSIVGDSSLSGGMAFEAINNVEKLNDSNFICILNDNNMAISKPVGNISNMLTKIRTSNMYDNAKSLFDQMIQSLPQSGPLKRRIERGIESIKNIILDQKVGVFFEEFGFKYLGPLDGHDIPTMMAALKYARGYKGPILIHCITQKGKGHLPAEQDPIKYHGVSPKKKSSPEIKPMTQSPMTHSQLFGKTMIDICKKRDDVVVITPAMIGGSGLTQFAETFPEKLFDVGIAEEHAITFAAGLSRAGTMPVVAIYSTFLQRGYDQLIHDVAIQELPMVLALDRAGLAGEDGHTHHGAFDMAYLLPVPNVTLLAPKDGQEMKEMLAWGVDQQKITSIRYGKGNVIDRPDIELESFSELKSEILCQTKNVNQYDFCLIGVGAMAWEAFYAAEKLMAKGFSVVVINLRVIKPLDKKTLEPFIHYSTVICVIEEGAAIGGVYSHIMHTFKDLDKPLSAFKQIALPDEFIEHGKIPSLRAKFGLSAEKIMTACEHWKQRCETH